MDRIAAFVSENAFFGVFLTIGFYLLFRHLSGKIRFPLFNPILLTVAALIGFLLLFDIPYEASRRPRSALRYRCTDSFMCCADT